MGMDRIKTHHMPETPREEIKHTTHFKNDSWECSSVVKRLLSVFKVLGLILSIAKILGSSGSLVPCTNFIVICFFYLSLSPFLPPFSPSLLLSLSLSFPPSLPPSLSPFFPDASRNTQIYIKCLSQNSQYEFHDIIKDVIFWWQNLWKKKLN